jgi:site-specific recombinase XerD
MLEELERSNYAQTTIDSYIHAVEHFALYFRRSPDQLGPDHIREYQVALFKKFKLAPNAVSQRLAALRFFYNSSFHFTAEVEIPQGGVEGMIVTQGGRFAGYGFYVLKSCCSSTKVSLRRS